MLSPNINMLSILSIFSNFNAPITLTGSVAEISDPYANDNSKESAFINMLFTFAIPINPANHIKKVVIKMATKVPQNAIRIIVPKCLKKGYLL